MGTQAAFLSAGGYHHPIGLNTWESAGGRAPAPGTTGLYHVAILVPTLAEGIPLDGAADDGTTVMNEALVLRDPDGNGENGVELYWDRPMENWPCTPDGGPAMFTKALNVQTLLAAANPREH